MILSSLHSSSVPESKLHFQKYFQQAGAGLAGAVEGRTGLPRGALLGALGGVQDLELYFPVADHRKGWLGSSEILVAGFIESEADIRGAGGMVLAYDVNGKSQLVPYDAPGERPVLVITGAEGGFGQDGASRPASSVVAPIPGDSGGPPPQNCDLNDPAGTFLWLCDVTITDIGRYEGVLRGSPEISIRFYSLAANGTDPQTIGCLHEQQPSPQLFDQNTDSWTGLAKIATKSAVTAAVNAGRTVVLHVWEDDNGSKCEFSQPTAGYAQILSYLTVFGTWAGFRWAENIECPGCAVLVQAVTAALATAALYVIGSNDDPIGMGGLPTTGSPFTTPWPIVTTECSGTSPLLFSCAKSNRGALRVITRP